MINFFKTFLVFIIIIIVLLGLISLLATRSSFVDLGSFKTRQTWSIKSFTFFSITKKNLLSDIVGECNFVFPSNWVCVNEHHGLIDGKGNKVFSQLEKGWIRPKISAFENSLLKKIEYELEIKGKKLEAGLFKNYCTDIGKFIEILNQSEKESDAEEFIKKFDEF